MKRNETLSEKARSRWRGDKKMFLKTRTRFME